MARLSVCLIAKNEQENLPRALQSVINAADEIVVTDTGSSDGTVEVARSFGARVERFAWNDDFAAAYNYCVSQARCEWILLLDADEELLPASHEELLRCVTREDVLAFTVLRQDLVSVTRLDQFTEMLHTRLFRNRPDMRYVGRIHHRFATSLHFIASTAGLQVADSSIRLRHYGYAGGDDAAKLARAAKLMELELQDRPGQFYYLVELGRTWITMRDARGAELLTTAARMARRDVQAILDSGGALCALLEFVLASDKLPTGFAISWQDAHDLTMRHFPNAVPLLWQIALRYFRREQFADCAKSLERIIELGATNSYDKRSSFQPSVLSGDAMLNLGVCYARLGRVKDARRCFLDLMDEPEYVDRSRANLAALHSLHH